MPQLPYQYRDTGGGAGTSGTDALDLSTLSHQINDSYHKQQNSYDVSRTLQVAINRANNVIEFQSQNNSQQPKVTVLEELKTSILTAIDTRNDGDEVDIDKSAGGEVAITSVAVDHRHPRKANLQNRVEDYVRLLAYDEFLQTGKLLPPSSTSTFATDEEYLSGACMGLCKDLERYGLGRATARDATSVVAARDLIQAILEYLMGFDFRNGPLRRKYDGTKYALKSLETILYELSVTGATSEGEGQEEGQKGTAETLLSPIQEELDGIRQRVAHRDELREQLIKNAVTHKRLPSRLYMHCIVTTSVNRQS